MHRRLMLNLPNEVKKAGKKHKQILTATIVLVRHDRYSASFPVKNRLREALRVLTTGRLKVRWEVPANRKDKRLRISGNREV